MALYCTGCRTMAREGSALCENCRNGFISKLACATCNKVVPSGQAFCATCAQGSSAQGYVGGRVEVFPGAGAIVPVPRGQIPPLASLSTLPALPPGLSPETMVVPERYSAGRFGADAEVQMNGRDAEILTKMNQVAMLLHALAAEMNTFQGMGESTRHLIKGCRNLATDLQEEVEVRKGPGR
jgi:RNA polymerase subunit RPABC4/transcription elongation factor Spt4